MGLTGSLSNGGSGGSTGSSAGRTTSIPWRSGTERNLGHCFGNQGGGRSAEGETEGEVERKHIVFAQCVTLELQLNI